MAWTFLILSALQIERGKFLEGGFSKLVVPNRTRISNLTRAVTGEGQEVPARRRQMQLRKGGAGEGGSGKHRAVPEGLNLQHKGQADWDHP